MVDISSLKDLSELIASDLQKSTSTRQNLGGGGAAFGWWADGLPPTLANYVQTSMASGMSVPLTLVGESGTPAIPVAPGVDKPAAVTITEITEPLTKFAGYGSVQLENQLNAAGIYPAVVGVLSASTLKAFEAHAMGVLAAQAGESGNDDTWISAIYSGQGIVLANGGRPSVLVASAADYGAIMSEVAASPGYSLDPESPTGAFAGSRIHFSSGLASGTAYVLDSSAVVCIQHDQSPVLSIDSSGINNTTRVIADLVATTRVTSPPLVCEITVTPA